MTCQVFVILPGSFWVRGVKCFNAAEAKLSHGRCVPDGGRAYGVGFPCVWLFAGIGKLGDEAVTGPWGCCFRKGPDVVCTQQHSSHTKVVEFHCWSDSSGFWMKKILSPKCHQQAQGPWSQSPLWVMQGFRWRWNYRAVAAGDTAAVTLSEYHKFINHKVCHNVIVPDLGMCSCQQDCQDCTLTPHGNSLYLLYN